MKGNKMESKELLTIGQGMIDFANNLVIKTLKETVAQGLTDPEFRLFAEHCKSTALNPFKKEVWAIKAGGRLQLMTGINGYFTIANRNPAFNGYEEGFIGKDGQELPDTYPGTDYVGAWCKVYRKDRAMPSKGVAFKIEYDKGHGNWKTMPKVMLLKCAESIALRKAFPQELNGTYTAEEMPREFEAKTDPIIVSTEIITESNPDAWTGEEIIQGGKNAGKAWKELSGDSIEWYVHNSKNPQVKAMAQKEQARREAVQQGIFEDINNQAAKVSDDFDNDELPTDYNAGEFYK